jgi:hypothetical protein
MVVGDPVSPIGSWSFHFERSKLPPGAQEGSRARGIRCGLNASAAVNGVRYRMTSVVMILIDIVGGNWWFIGWRNILRRIMI